MARATFSMREVGFAFLLKTYGRDAKSSLRLIKSWKEHNIERIPLYIVVPRSDYSLFDRMLSEHLSGSDGILHLLIEEDICPYLTKENVNGISAGYLNQEIVKLSFWETGICTSYFCLDADGMFIRDFYLGDFIHDDGYPYTVLFEDNDLKSDPEYWSVFWQPREQAIRQIQDAIEYKEKKIITCHGFQILHTDVLKSLKDDFMEVRGYEYEDLLRIAPYEFSWYNLWLQKKRTIEIHYSDEIFKCLHTAKQYADTVISGVTIEDLKRSYVGIILNGNWTGGYDLRWGELDVVIDGVIPVNHQQVKSAGKMYRHLRNKLVKMTIKNYIGRSDL